MMGGGRNLLWLAPLLLLLAWPIYGGVVKSFLIPPQIADSFPSGGPGEEAGQRFSMSGVRFFQELAGERQWRIDSRELRSGDGQLLLLSGVEALLFGPEEAARLEIIAQNGVYHQERGRLELEGDVKLTDNSGFTLKTPALVHEEKEGLVSSRAGVSVIHQEMQVRADNLDYRLADGRYLLTGQVHLTMP